MLRGRVHEDFGLGELALDRNSLQTFFSEACPERPVGSMKNANLLEKACSYQNVKEYVDF
ncbi:hypothetical protein NECAME_07368 [Necator americanus]|uniref:Uncharacterized protein n=1 Tax=Necator americanus TaxID=51031 RepID=W2TQZ7_NECAM|nr:hypothetical protein NECAME_07368 [Necator americanus]ETN83546.1 hypothetical protein NECAME_07368 [Necator americanus]